MLFREECRRLAAGEEDREAAIAGKGRQSAASVLWCVIRQRKAAMNVGSAGWQDDIGCYVSFTNPVSGIIPANTLVRSIVWKRLVMSEQLPALLRRSADRPQGQGKKPPMIACPVLPLDGITKRIDLWRGRLRGRTRMRMACIQRCCGDAEPAWKVSKGQTLSTSTDVASNLNWPRSGQEVRYEDD